jgi:hypothetical protein
MQSESPGVRQMSDTRLQLKLKKKKKKRFWFVVAKWAENHCSILLVERIYWGWEHFGAILCTTQISNTSMYHPSWTRDEYISIHKFSSWFKFNSPHFLIVKDIIHRQDQRWESTVDEGQYHAFAFNKRSHIYSYVVVVGNKQVEQLLGPLYG